MTGCYGSNLEDRHFQAMLNRHLNDTTQADYSDKCDAKYEQYTATDDAFERFLVHDYELVFKIVSELRCIVRCGNTDEINAAIKAIRAKVDREIESIVELED